MHLSKCRAALTKLFHEMIRRATAVKHKTVWVYSPLYDNIESSKLFILVTTDEERARQIKECLENADLLCHTDLGTVNLRSGLAVEVEKFIARAKNSGYNTWVRLIGLFL